MAYSKEPLLSPKLFEKLMVPRYKKITKILNEHNVSIVVDECDGNIEQLVPGWLEAGVNCMFPLEARYVDPYKLREKNLIASEKAIDKELERLTPLLKEGEYIPTVDHRAPPEVSYQTYLYYLKR